MTTTNMCCKTSGDTDEVEHHPSCLTHQGAKHHCSCPDPYHTEWCDGKWIMPDGKELSDVDMLKACTPLAEYIDQPAHNLPENMTYEEYIPYVGEDGKIATILHKSEILPMGGTMRIIPMAVSILR